MNLLKVVSEFFGSEKRARQWFKTPNPMLGDVTPNQMIRIGRKSKLEHFIKTQIAENRRD